MVKRFSYLVVLLLFLFIGVFSSCQKLVLNSSSDLVPSSATQYIATDSFTVQLSTIYLDSTTTSATGVALIGNYSDPDFGVISSDAYAVLTPPDYGYDAEQTYKNTLYDSLVLVLKTGKGFYGDSSQPFMVNVNRVTQQILSPDITNNGSNFYNTTTFSLNPTPITYTPNRSHIVRPHGTNTDGSSDTICIRLNDDLGRLWYSMLTRGSDTIKTASAFQNYFQGINIAGDASDKIIIGCTDTIEVRLYYTKFGTINTSNYVSFTMQKNTTQFNHITVDRSALTNGLQNLGSGKAAMAGTQRELLSNTTNNAAYCQPLTGATIKVRIPNIPNLSFIPNFSKVLRAVLTIRPINYAALYFLPPQLRLNTYDQSMLTLPEGQDLALPTSGQLTTQMGNLYVDYFNQINTSYTYDLTSYVTSLLTDLTYETNKKALLLLPPSPNFTTQFSRIIVGNKLQPRVNYRTVLTIYYLTVQ